jgi:hypothetical protein
MQTLIPLLSAGGGHTPGSAAVERTIIFTNKKRVAAWVAKTLERDHNIQCAQIHGDRSQAGAASTPIPRPHKNQSGKMTKPVVFHYPSSCLTSTTG